MQIQRLTLLPADVNRREPSGEQLVPQLREGEKANREVDGADAAAADDEPVRLGPPRDQVEGVAVELKAPSRSLIVRAASRVPTNSLRARILRAPVVRQLAPSSSGFKRTSAD